MSNTTEAGGSQRTNPRGMSSDMPVVLVGCSWEKAPIPAPARALYRSERFRRAAGWAEASGCPWFVLSGKHGLVAPDEVLAPYDVDLTTATSGEVSAWARRVVAGLVDRLPAIHTAIILAADAYATPVAACLGRVGISCERRLDGLNAAERLQRLAVAFTRLVDAELTTLAPHTTGLRQ